MENIKTIIIGLSIFLFLITIHELGHFIGAKLSGIKVNEFAIGMGPKIFTYQGEETLYSLRALPIGGYVAMEGEELDSEDGRSYNNAKAWKRFLTIFAGPFMNIIFAVIVIFFITLSNGVVTNVVDTVKDNYPAQMSGIEPGDRIIKIDNTKINYIHEIGNVITKDNKSYNFVVKRDNETIEMEITPIEENGNKLIGITGVKTKDLISSVKYSISLTLNIMYMIFTSLIGLLTGKIGLDQLSGPVGVIGQVGTAASFGLQSLFMFAAMISINLGFFNLLPIPALDGSKLIFNLYEMIVGKPFNRKFEEKITIIGFLFLLGLIILVSIKDIIKLFI